MSGIDNVVIPFAGNVTISNIRQVHDDISTAMAEGESLILDVEAIAETDLTFVQLVESARRKAEETGVSLTLRHPAAGPLLEVLQRGGFLDGNTSDRAKFWLQGTAQ